MDLCPFPSTNIHCTTQSSRAVNILHAQLLVVIPIQQCIGSLLLLRIQVVGSLHLSLPSRSCPPIYATLSPLHFEILLHPLNFITMSLKATKSSKDCPRSSPVYDLYSEHPIPVNQASLSPASAYTLRNYSKWQKDQRNYPTH